jgi:hypothetical protein
MVDVGNVRVEVVIFLLLILTLIEGKPELLGIGNGNGKPEVLAIGIGIGSDVPCCCCCCSCCCCSCSCRRNVEDEETERTGAKFDCVVEKLESEFAPPSIVFRSCEESLLVLCIRCRLSNAEHKVVNADVSRSSRLLDAVSTPTEAAPLLLLSP